MKEKGQTTTELRFQHNDTLPASEKGKDAKLKRLNPGDLIPPEFANIPIITGQVSAVVHRSDRHIDYVVIDEGKMSLSQIKKDFTYFYGEKLEEYPELKRGKNKYARPLVHGDVSEISPAMLFISMFETNPVLRGKGAGVAFLKHVENLAKNLGYKFLAGYQIDTETARFFLRRGRYLLEEIKDELQTEFRALREQESEESVFYTVQFLNHEDIAKYIKPERVTTDVEDKIEFKEKIVTLGEVFDKLSELLKKVEEGEENVGDRATLIEIMEDLNQILPEEDRYNLPALSEDDDNLVLNLKVLLEHLKSKSSALVREATLEELRENIA